MAGADPPRPRRRRRLKLVAIVAGSVVVVLALGAYLLAREPAAPATLARFRADPLPPDRASRLGLDVAGTHAKLDLGKVGAAWYLNWTDKPDPSLHGEFVPLVCGYPGSGRVSPHRLASDRDYIRAHAGQYPDGTVWLIGNEIGYKPQRDQRSPAQYAADLHDCARVLKAINPAWKVSVGPVVLSTSPVLTSGQKAGTGLAYLRAVLAAYRSAYGQSIPADYFAATAYVIAPSTSQWSLYRHAHHELDLHLFEQQVLSLRRLLADAGLRDRSVILTELGDPFAGGQPAHIAAFLAGASHYLATATDPALGSPADGDHLVQRWGWFLAQPMSTTQKLLRFKGAALLFDLAQTSLFNRSGHLTYLGHAYAQLTGAAKAAG